MVKQELTNGSAHIQTQIFWSARLRNMSDERETVFQKIPLWPVLSLMLVIVALVTFYFMGTRS